jgi:hypothetical protein
LTQQPPSEPLGEDHDSHGDEQELREDNIPPPGFVEPISRKLEKAREGNRKVILLGLLAYLALWSIGSLLLAVFGKTQEAIELATILALPALPLLGIAIGSCFERNRR